MEMTSHSCVEQRFLILSCPIRAATENLRKLRPLGEATDPLRSAKPAIETMRDEELSTKKTNLWIPASIAQLDCKICWCISKRSTHAHDVSFEDADACLASHRDGRSHYLIAFICERDLCARSPQTIFELHLRRSERLYPYGFLSTCAQPQRLRAVATRKRSVLIFRFELAEEKKHHFRRKHSLSALLSLHLSTSFVTFP